MIEVRELGLAGLKEIRIPVFQDFRGDFSETWSASRWSEAGIDLMFVQDNQSRSAKGVLRGLHYQLPPMAQDKVVRVTCGAIFDVAVDIRQASPGFGKWFGTVLTASCERQLLVPAGFAHGFLALEDETQVNYKTTAQYSSFHERRIRFDDPAIGISWPVLDRPLILDDKDQQATLLAEVEVFE